MKRPSRIAVYVDVPLLVSGAVPGPFIQARVVTFQFPTIPASRWCGAPGVEISAHVFIMASMAGDGVAAFVSWAAAPAAQRRVAQTAAARRVATCVCMMHSCDVVVDERVPSGGSWCRVPGWAVLV
jgi:hypothetical protein